MCIPLKIKSSVLSRKQLNFTTMDYLQFSFRLWLVSYTSGGNRPNNISCRRRIGYQTDNCYPHLADCIPWSGPVVGKVHLCPRLFCFEWLWKCRIWKLFSLFPCIYQYLPSLQLYLRDLSIPFWLKNPLNFNNFKLHRQHVPTFFPNDIDTFSVDISG